MKDDKFLMFLESITTQDNKVVVEAITQGYVAILESYQENFRGRGQTHSLEGKVAKQIAILQQTAERRQDDRAIDSLDAIMGAYKVGEMGKAINLFEKLPTEIKNSSAGFNLNKMLNA